MARKFAPRVNKHKNSIINRTDTRAKVLNSIKDYYTGLKISDNIHKIKVNMTKYWKRDANLWESDIKAIYDKYNIVYYKSKEEYMLSKEEYELTDKQKQTLWEDYEHRHKLIVSGQYEDYRAELFRDNYIKAMRRIGAGEKEIQILQDIPLSQWGLLEITPQAQKDNARDKQLPPLGTFSYNDKSLLAEVRKDLKVVLKEQLDVDYEWDEESNIKKSLKYIKALIKPEDRDDLLQEGNEIELYTDMIRHVPFEKLKKTKPSKNDAGHYYIRGVGSETGKNSQLIKDILKEYGIK